MTVFKWSCVWAERLVRSEPREHPGGNLLEWVGKSVVYPRQALLAALCRTTAAPVLKPVAIICSGILFVIKSCRVWFIWALSSLFLTFSGLLFLLGAWVNLKTSYWHGLIWQLLPEYTFSHFHVISAVPTAMFPAQIQWFFVNADVHIN